MTTLQEYKFIAMLLPGSVLSKKNINGDLEVSFSLVLNVNNYCKDFDTDNDLKKVESRHSAFYDELQKLKDFWDTRKLQIGFSPDNNTYEWMPAVAGKTPYDYVCGNSNATWGTENFKKIKNDLWDSVFPTIKVSSPEFSGSGGIMSSASTQNTGEIIPLLDRSEDIPFLETFRLNETEHKQMIAGLRKDSNGMPVSKIKKTLQKIHDFGKQREKIAYAEKIRIMAARRGADYQSLIDKLSLKNNSDKEKAALLEQIITFEDDVIRNYVNARQSIDMDEVLHSITAISAEPALMRLMGFINDYKVTVPAKYTPQIAPVSNFYIKADIVDPCIHFPCTAITALQANGKVAFLVGHNKKSEVYFKHSILLSKGSSLATFDKVSKISNLIDYAEKMVKNTTSGSEGSKDALSRGILYSHTDLAQIIQPYKEDPNSEFDISLSTVMTDDHVVRGHRVAVRINDKETYSLTSRSLELKLDNESQPFYTCKVNESCIHFDAPATYMEDGEVKLTVSDELFEYSGELLKLNTAFSRGVRRQPGEEPGYDDGGLKKSYERFNGIVNFKHFPFNKVYKKALIDISYSIPGNFSRDHAPRLRFNNSYQFIVWQEYANGMGIPTEPQTTLQASLKDILNSFAPGEVISDSLTFRPLESKKTPLLYHRSPVSLNENSAISERPSLDHFVVTSDSSSDTRQYIAERHVLPPKIEIEPAYWHGLLSEPNMDELESFNIKRRANCPFEDLKAYNVHVANKYAAGNNLKCVEACSRYCGGTQMELNYPERQIKPRFLTDPQVTGFNLELYWDQAYQQPVINGQNFEYNGKPGISPDSVLLRTIGSAGETFIQGHTSDPEVNVCVKKGMTLYGKLTNTFPASVRTSLFTGWWDQLPSLRNRGSNNIQQIQEKETRSLTEDLFLIRYKTEVNPPRAITITHAVKQPLVSPKIFKLSSQPTDTDKIAHIYPWLQKKNFKDYKKGVNIIALRVNKDTGVLTQDATFAKVGLTAHFERLDAKKKFEFLQNVIPTGGLELWMRKEVYKDDPRQTAFDPRTNTYPANHVPYEPVMPFSDPCNQFILEHKIEFTPEIMHQLKDLANVSDADKTVKDAFRDIVTSLELMFDLKTVCFEEREYYLKGISRFRGFFTDKKPGNDEAGVLDMETYVLPKIVNVISDPALRFKVMVLNNKVPQKPEVAFAVTTIAEKRVYPGKNQTVVTQKGNIVTIYLKRDRLQSGRDERVGLITESNSKYYYWFKKNNMITTVGRDIVSDRSATRTHYLQKGDVKTGGRYDAGYDDSLGIAHFLPKFDFEKQLWKIEVDLEVFTVDGMQLHNPFINFCLVHYQPFSINHNGTNDKILPVPELDCRISAVENSAWCYLLPERKLSVTFKQPNLFSGWGNVDFTLTFDLDSLHHYKGAAAGEGIIRTNFILTVQGSDDEVIWSAIESKIDGENWAFHHPLLKTNQLVSGHNTIQQALSFTRHSNPSGVGNSTRYSYFRVRFIEVEWFLNESWESMLQRNSNLLKDDMLDNEDMRLRYVELIY